MHKGTVRCVTLMRAALISLAVMTTILFGNVAAALAQPGARPGGQAQARGIPLPRMAPFAHMAAPNPRAAGRPGNFPFQTATSADGLIVVHYYWRPSSFAGDFFGMAQQALGNYIKPTLGYGLASKVNIYVYNSRADFLAGALPDSPDLTAAYTDFTNSSIYLPLTADGDGFATLAHEMTHAAFHQQADAGHLQSDYDLYPLWLDEGLAAPDQPEYSSDTLYLKDLLNQHLGYGDFVPIFRTFIWNYPSDLTTDNLSYAEARAFIKYLEATYGLTRFHQFIGDLKDGDVAFAAELAFGADLQTLQNQWEGSLGLPVPGHSPPTMPVAATPVSYYVGRLTGIATQTKPFALGGGGDWLFIALLLAAGGTGAVLLGLGAARLRARQMRRRYFARQTSIALALPPSIAAGSPVATSATSTLHDAERVAQPAMPARQIASSEQVALALVVPLALSVGLLWARFDPTQSWMRAYLAGAVAAAVIALGPGVLLWRAWRARRIVVAHVVTLGVLLAGAAGTAATGQQAGIAQGHEYATATAYALALRTLTDAHASRTDLAQVQTDWALAAYQVSDFADATTHFRAAVALAETPAAAKDPRAVLVKLTGEWGAKLVGAQHYDQAVQVYASELGDASCDKTCRATLVEAVGAAYLAWANALVVTRHISDGMAKLRELAQRFPTSKASATAKIVLTNGGKGPAAAWAAGKAGDAAAMNLLLETYALQTRDPVQAALAAESDEPVTGQLPPLYLYKSAIHIFLLAFPSTQAAAAFATHGAGDTSLFKVATTADASGVFTVWLPSGYTYSAVWEAAPQNGKDDYFYRGTTTFSVRPFTPTGAGTLVAN